MAYVLFDSAWFNDTRPVDSATAIDVVKGDLRVLKEESPCETTWPIINGPPSTTSATYTDASCLWRSGRIRLREGLFPGQVRRLQFRMFVRVSNVAGTATLRAWAAPRFAVPANALAPDHLDFVTAESATTTDTAGKWLEWTLSVRSRHTAPDIRGGDELEATAFYRCVYVGVHGKITNGHTLTLDEGGVEEVP